MTRKYSTFHTAKWVGSIILTQTKRFLWYCKILQDPHNLGSKENSESPLFMQHYIVLQIHRRGWVGLTEKKNILCMCAWEGQRLTGCSPNFIFWAEIGGGGCLAGNNRILRLIWDFIWFQEDYNSSFLKVLWQAMGTPWMLRCADDRHKMKWEKAVFTVHFLQCPSHVFESICHLLQCFFQHSVIVLKDTIKSLDYCLQDARERKSNAGVSWKKY